MRQEYTSFVTAFRLLNPYELDHFGDFLFMHLMEIMQLKDTQKIHGQDLKQALTCTMRDINLEVAKLGIQEAELHLEIVRSETMADAKVPSQQKNIKNQN